MNPPTRSPTILLTVQSADPGGAQRMALAEAEYLRRWYRLVIAVPRGPLRAEFAKYGDVIAGPPSLPLWGASAQQWLKRAVRTGIDTIRLRGVIRRNGIRAVVTNSGVSMSPVLAASWAGVPVLVHARDTLKSRLAGPARRVQSRLADTVIANSNVNAAPFRDGKARLVRIYDGIELPLRPGPPPAFASPLRLCVIAAIDRNKGQDTAIRALFELSSQGVPARLDLVGPTPDPVFAEEVLALARQLEVDHLVHMRGHTNDVDAAFHESDVVLVPSLGESLGLSPMEALARGRPVVASRVGGIPEVVKDGRTGILTTVRDAEEMAAAVVSIAADPAAAIAMAARGRADIAERFDLRLGLARVRAEIDAALESTRTAARWRSAVSQPARPGA